MIRRVLGAAFFAVVVSSCSGGIDRTVDRPIGDVEAILQASTDKLYIADQLPGAGHSIEASDGRVVWHFTLNDQDYARMNFSLAAAGPQSTRVTANFEEVNDAQGEGVPYLREMAKAVSHESAAAAIEGRPVDMAVIQDAMKMVATNPSAVMGAQRAIWAEAVNIGEANNSRGSYQPPQAYDAPQPYDKPQPYDSPN